MLTFDLLPADKGAQYRWPPKDPSKLASNPHPWHTGGASSPFTYGNGFNPALQPSNMRQRSTPSESGTSISSGSDDDLDVHIPDTYNHDTQDYDYTSEEDEATTVRVRRGSEGYEVRPRAWVLD